MPRHRNQIVSAAEREDKSVTLPGGTKVILGRLAGVNKRQLR